MASPEEYKKRRAIEDKLWEGDFETVQIDLNEWMIGYDWNFLRCTAHGCCVNGKTDLLSSITSFLHDTIQKPNSESITDTERLRYIIRNSGSYPSNIDTASQQELVDFRNWQLVRNADRVIQAITYWVSDLQDKDKKCGEIIEMLSKSPVRNCRLYCCGTVNDLKPFLMDDDERIKKVATIRATFDEKLETYSDDEKDLVSFLTSALDNGTINLFDGLIPYFHEDGTLRDDLVCASFQSVLFKQKGANTFIHEFDQDIFSTIKDLRILADALYELLSENKFTFVEGMQPASWDKLVAAGIKRKL